MPFPYGKSTSSCRHDSNERGAAAFCPGDADTKKAGARPLPATGDHP
ncbi:hypothetical protein DESPIG_02896 [Desulfovibrio piger ATCC 29098]|uniref:Uncharacterized protein n=1 Tax=Desulfovibrio piger ATCC 29098 TaxID=411464 RepID=B6WXR7_9BACT|nr:hypothetical protein DESPIG_02896 [Desulfovibrio piger ATCC 29098]